MNLTQLENESFLQWKLRLIAAKINKEIDTDWSELSEVLGLGVSGDHLRKTSYGIMEYKEYFEQKVEEGFSDEELSKLTIKKFEVQKERNKLSAEKNEINKWIREQARTENIYEKIELAIGKLEPVHVPEVKIEVNNKIRTAVIDVADSHFGRQGKITGFHGETIAEYSVEIFKQRMWDLLDRVVVILAKEKIEFVTVLNLGDSVDGLLRFSQLQFLQLGIADQTMQYAEFMSEWLNKLSNYAKVDYRSVLGNHTESRPLNSQRGDFVNENNERLIVWYIKTRLAGNKNVTVHDPASIIYFDVLGTKILVAHGQDERNLENSIKDYMMIYQVPVHILKTGHLHHLNNKTIGMSGLQNIEFVQSPAICGIDEYSVKLKKTANAGSLVTVFEADYGKSCTYDIRLK